MRLAFAFVIGLAVLGTSCEPKAVDAPATQSEAQSAAPAPTTEAKDETPKTDVLGDVGEFEPNNAGSSASTGITTKAP